MKKSLYATLGVDSKAGDASIRDAYEALVAKLDPGDSVGRIAAKEAYGVLSHTQRRAAYDASLLEAERRQRHAPTVAVPEPASSNKMIWAAGLVAVAALGWWVLRPHKADAAKVVSKQDLGTVEVMRRDPGAPVAVTTKAEADAGQAMSPEALFSKASASVVRINVADASGDDLKQGSGVVIDRGTVITNCHVVKGGAKVKVKYLRDQYDATVTTADEQHDLCKLSVLGLSAPAITVGKVAGLRVGQKVFAIGSPQGLDLTLSDGMVSSLRETREGTYIQTTAPISPGSSGGGLFTETGVLVGIVTFQMRSGQNLNFAIPADWIASISPTTETESDRDSAPARPASPMSPTIAAIQGAWHCYGSLTGRGMDVTFEPNNNFSGIYDGKPIGGQYYLSNKQLTLAGEVFQIEEISSTRIVLNRGEGRRLACNR